MFRTPEKVSENDFHFKLILVDGGGGRKGKRKGERKRGDLGAGL